MSGFGHPIVLLRPLKPPPVEFLFPPLHTKRSPRVVLYFQTKMTRDARRSKGAKFKLRMDDFNFRSAVAARQMGRSAYEFFCATRWDVSDGMVPFLEFSCHFHWSLNYSLTFTIEKPYKNLQSAVTRPIFIEMPWEKFCRTRRSAVDVGNAFRSVA